MSSHKQKRTKGTSGVLMAGQALRMLRLAPLSAHAAYLVGTVPFVAAWLWFWSDMAYGAYAYRRIASSAMLLTLLFVWMKVWQAYFASQLLAFAADEAAPRWRARTVLRSILLQGVLQPSGFLLLPVAMLVTIPYPWCSAFYQNLMLLDGPTAKSPSGIVREAARLAGGETAQNVRIIWLLSPWSVVVLGGLIFGVMGFMMRETMAEIGQFGGVIWFAVSIWIAIQTLLPLAPFGAVIFANSAILLVTIPYLLNTLFGIQTPFSTVGPATIFNSSFLAITFGMTYLIMAPLFTAANALRCFELASRRDGRDLLTALRRAKRQIPVILLLLLPLAATLDATAAETPETTAIPAADASSLDASIDTVLQNPRYSWRMPHERDRAARKLIEADEGGWVSEFVKMISEWTTYVRRLINNARWRMRDFIERIFYHREPSMGGGFSPDSLRGLAVLLVIVLACTIAVLLIQSARRSRLQKVVDAEALPELSASDLLTEEITADQRPSDEWRRLADSLVADGEYRLAVRALFLSMLALLGRAGLVTIARYKANRDYLADLQRRAHDTPSTIANFSKASATVECHWYGTHRATLATVERIRYLVDALPIQQDEGETS